MSKKSRFGGTFKFGGIRWIVRHYWRNGEKRYCYAPEHSYEPIFSKTSMTLHDIKEDCMRQDAARK